MLAPVFRVGGRRLSAIDIRLANARYWTGDGGDPLPVAVMGSPTSEAALLRWRDRLAEPHRTSVRMFLQHGIYRLDRSLITEDARRPWVDSILRHVDGSPSLKPHGGMGVLSALVISGLFETWERDGVAFLAVANGYDALYRLDPGVIGYLKRYPDVDGVIVGIPWGFRAVIQQCRGPAEIRADESGWSINEWGNPLSELPIPAHREYDAGGAIVRTGDRLSVFEGVRPPGSLYNTNQIYLRLTAVRRLMMATGATNPAEAMRRIVADLPSTLDDRTVMIDGSRRYACQLNQPVHGLLLLLARCGLVTATRRIGPGVRGSYAKLKHPTDVRFAQSMLDALQATEKDELVLAQMETGGGT